MKEEGPHFASNFPAVIGTSLLHRRREKEPRNRCIVLILYICTLERTTLTSTNSYKYLCLLTNDDNGPMS